MTGQIARVDITPQGGAARSYLFAGGKDLGNFTGPGFVQQNIKAVHPSPEFNPAMEVYFRNDVGASTRGEVVIELFNSGNLAASIGTYGNPATTVLPPGVIAEPIQTPFTIEAFDAADNPIQDHLGRTVVTAPYFGWGTRYRFQTSVRPIIQTVDQLVAARLLPPWGTKGLPGTLPPLFGGVTLSAYLATINYTNPMDMAGVDPTGPDTGERPDIGLTTEWGAFYAIYSNDPTIGPPALSAMLATGEVSATWPIHFRDSGTGAPISKLTYPSCNNYNNSNTYQGNPCLASPPAAIGAPWRIIPDISHYDSLSYIPAISTGDSFHLEEQQFAANFALIANCQQFNGNACVGLSGNGRAVAWGIRAIFEAWSATVQAEKNGSLPPWLQPSSYFDAILKNSIPLFEVWTKSTAAWAKFHTMPLVTGDEPWMNKYMAVVMMFGGLVGRTDYQQICEWVVQNQVDWLKAVPAFPDPYYFVYVTIASGLSTGSGPTGTMPDQAFWSDIGTAFVAWANNDIIGAGGQITQAQLNQLIADPLNGGVLVEQQADYACNYPRGVMAFATYMNTLGLINMPDAPSCLDRITSLIQKTFGGQFNSFSARWAFMPSLDGTIPAFTPLPPPALLPASVPNPAPAPTPPAPAPPGPISPDGSVITPAQAGASLTTAEGTWTFGVAGVPGGNAILLNGANTGGAIQLQITNGQIYAFNSLGQWYDRQNGTWVGIPSAPTEASTPVPPVPPAPPPVPLSGSTQPTGDKMTNYVKGATVPFTTNGFVDSKGVAVALPAGMAPTYSLVDSTGAAAPQAGTVSAVATNADGSFGGSVAVGTVTGTYALRTTLVYPDADVVAVPDVPFGVIDDEAISAVTTFGAPA